jgi:hypothetical protein
MNDLLFNIDTSNDSNEFFDKASINSNLQCEVLKTSYSVDMGFPSNTIWAKYNLGANPFIHNKNLKGTFFSLSDIANENAKKHTQTFDKGKITYYIPWDITEIYNPLKNYGINQKTPTIEQFAELMENSNASIKQDNETDSYVIEFISKYNGNIVRIPVEEQYDEHNYEHVGNYEIDTGEKYTYHFVTYLLYGNNYDCYEFIFMSDGKFGAMLKGSINDGKGFYLRPIIVL